MPIEVENLSGGLGVLFRCRGPLAGKDFIHANDGILASREHYQWSRYVLVDTSDANPIEVSSVDLRAIAEQSEQLAKTGFENIVVAIVAPQDLAFGLARMWEVFVYKTGWVTMSFRSRNDAETWIRQRMQQKTNGEVAV